MIIDLQNDFMPGGNLAVPGGDTIVPVINNLQPRFDLVIATQDWHPPDHLSFASNHTGRKPFEQINWQGQPEILWPDHCIQNSNGAAFHPRLATSSIAAIFRKGMNRQWDSYSGFYDNHHYQSTGLAGFLREKGVTGLYCCGLCADVCVYYSLRDALTEGFTCTLIEDATRALDSATYARQKAELQARGAYFITAGSIQPHPC